MLSYALQNCSMLASWSDSSPNIEIGSNTIFSKLDKDKTKSTIDWAKYLRKLYSTGLSHTTNKTTRCWTSSSGSGRALHCPPIHQSIVIHQKKINQDWYTAAAFLDLERRHLTLSGSTGTNCTTQTRPFTSQYWFKNISRTDASKSSSGAYFRHRVRFLKESHKKAYSARNFSIFSHTTSLETLGYPYLQTTSSYMFPYQNCS